jgi:membrane protein YdbS with pleckstrin-like domain
MKISPRQWNNTLLTTGIYDYCRVKYHMETLHSNVRIVWTVGVLVGVVVVGVVVGAINRFVLHSGVWIGPVVALIVAVLAVPFVLVRYRIWRFEIQDDALYLKRGVFTRVTTAVPFVRVQHVDTQRGPIERLVGLASVVVYTAGSRGADVTIPGLRPERADEIQNQLRDLAIESDEDAV